MSLVAPLVDGVLQTKTDSGDSLTQKSKDNSTVDSDMFLTLLVAEMQNQDPLEPTTNTEWISQMATFSQLEELQSLSKTTENTQIFSLVGKNVIVSTEDASGNKQLKEGIVDFISMVQEPADLVRLTLICRIYQYVLLRAEKSVKYLFPKKERY